MTPELNLKIAEWRQKAREGTLTREEMREGIAALRQGRVSAAIASDGARSKSKKQNPASVDSDALLGELGGLGL